MHPPKNASGNSTFLQWPKRTGMRPENKGHEAPIGLVFLVACAPVIGILVRFAFGRRKQQNGAEFTAPLTSRRPEFPGARFSSRAPISISPAR